MTESTKPRTIIEVVILAALAGGGGFQYYDNGNEVEALQGEIGEANFSLDDCEAELSKAYLDLDSSSGERKCAVSGCE